MDGKNLCAKVVRMFRLEHWVRMAECAAIPRARVWREENVPVGTYVCFADKECSGWNILHENRKARMMGDPSLRLKSGCAQDDAAN